MDEIKTSQAPTNDPSMYDQIYDDAGLDALVLKGLNGENLTEEEKKRFAALARVAYALIANEDKISSQEYKITELDGMSRDKSTESLIPVAFQKLLSDLEADGTFETMTEKDWSVQLCMIDLNKLGQHNDLGGQEGGNAALKATTDVLKTLFRRNGGEGPQDLPADEALPTYQQHKERIEHAVRSDKAHDVICRLGGDEFIVLSFLPKKDEEYKKDIDTMHNEVQRLEKAFRNIRATYRPIRGSVSPKKITSDALIIDSTINQDGTVSAEITTTFCVTRIKAPLNSGAVSSAIAELDNSIEDYKAHRKDIATKGIIQADYLE